MGTLKNRRTLRLGSLAVLAGVAVCAGWGPAVAQGGGAQTVPGLVDEYQIMSTGPATHVTVNRVQGLQVDFAQGGVRILPLAGEAHWQVGWSLASYGPLDGAGPVSVGAVSVNGARLEQRFGGGVSSWYLNAEDGLVQGFTLDGPPGLATAEGLYNHEINLLLATDGADARSVADGSIVFVTPGQREVLRDALVSGTAANGAVVPVKVQLINRPEGAGTLLQLVAVVDGGEATYPVRILFHLDTRNLKSGDEAATAAPDDVGILAPTEDTCAGAQVIPAGPYPVLSTTVNNSTATDTGDPTNTCQTNSHLGLWYSFTPTTNDTFIVTTCKNQAPGTTRSDTVLSVYTSAGGCAGPLTQVVCNDDYSGCTGYTLQSRLTFAGTAGTTYYILAYSYGTTGGDFQIQVDKQAPPPANDVCTGAQVVPPSGPWPYLTSIVNNGSATSTNDPNATCETSEALGLWYTFTPDTTGQYYITTCQNMAPGNDRQDTILDIFTSSSDCSGTFTELGASTCSDDNTECEGHTLQSVIQPTLTAGTTYYILAYNYLTSTTGNIQLYVEPSPPPPPNDDCSAAQVIPGSGPFPYLTTTVDLTNATVTNDPTVWSCLSTVNHVAWYEFTPSATGVYAFTTCKNQAPGTTCLDTVLSVYTSSTGACGGTYTSQACNDNDSTCTGAGNLSRMSVTMFAGTKYYVLVGSPGTTLPQPGKVQLEVTFTPPPANDTCSAPVALTAGVPVAGSTVGSFNDYQLSSAAPTCFTLPATPAPIGQTASTAPGRDVIYSFTPAASGNYSCRAYSYATTQNLVLYVADSCPAATPGTPLTVGNPPCVGASNRSTTSWQEEVMCVPMTGGQTYYVYVDDNVTNNTGSTFYVKCTPCNREVETNNTPATSNPFVCGIEGSISPAADVDFFGLVGAATDSRIFALADGGAASTNDFDMRITTGADTLQYDDASADTPFGGLAPTVDGTKLANGPPYYIRMSHYSSTTQAEPYRLYAVVEPARGSEIPETEPNDTSAQANANALNYFSGTMVAAADADWYSFTANLGDVIFVGLDTDPNYDGTANNLALTLYDATGTAVLVTVNGSTGVTGTLNRPPTVGNLAATLPVAYGEALEWNAHYTGTYYVKVTDAGTTFGQEYALAIAKNCQTDSTDFSVTKSDDPDPVATGQNLTYTVVVSNAGPGAGGATMSDPLPAGTTFVSAGATSGWTCSGPPVGGTGTVSCSGSLASGGSATITIVVKVGWCLGSSTISNTATVTASGTDPVPGNDSATTTTTVTDDGTCSDDNACTTGDLCSGNVCVPGTATDCNDNDACTTDSCNTSSGECEHSAVTCDDNNTCTDDSCDTLLGCQYTNDDTNTCSDGSLCTTDACVGGTCIGTPTVFCDDLNQCTVDACNPASGLCEYAPTPGLSCDDGDACTTSDRCAAASGPNLTQSFDAETPPGLPAGWTTQLITGLTGDIAWETTASFFDSAPNSVYTNDPTHVTDKVLVSPPFTGLGGAQVSFRNRYDLENSSGTPTLAYDGGVLEIRIGAGAWQDIITAGGAWVSGGYNATVSSSFSNPLAGRAAWSGASAGGFITTAVTMPAAADGETVQLRWRVGTDTSAGKNGQWIDDVVIPTGVPACVGTPAPPPVEVNASVAVSNLGTLATISWTDPPGPFNVYRGATTGSWSYNQTCFDPNTAGPSTDPAVPTPGESYYYLVSRRDACGESVLGRDSSGTADPNPSPCP